MSNTLELSGLFVCLGQLIKFFSTSGNRKKCRVVVCYGDQYTGLHYGIHILVFLLGRIRGRPSHHLLIPSTWENPTSRCPSHQIFILYHPPPPPFYHQKLIPPSSPLNNNFQVINQWKLFSFEKSSKSLLLRFPHPCWKILPSSKIYDLPVPAGGYPSPTS